MDKIIQYITAAIAICTLIMLYIYATFFYRFSFNYETDINGQYLATFIAVAGFTAILGLNIFRKTSNQAQYFWPIIITLLLLFSIFSGRYSFANEYWAVVLVVFVLFACLLFLPVRHIVVLPYLLCAMLLWQLGLAFEQMEGFNFDADEFTIQGSLQNSGIFSCYLVIHLPLLYYVFSHQSGLNSGLARHPVKTLKLICLLAILVFIGFVVYRSQSRSAMIGVVAAVVSQGLLTYGRTIKNWLQRIPKWVTVTGIVFLLIATTYGAWYLFFLKKVSALGRTMKWEIAGRHIGDFFFTGTGVGRFSWYYPQWQAEYFSTCSNPSGAYLSSVGESYIIFNEYLQLFETIGLIGFAGFLLLLYCFFYARSVRYARLLSAIKATMVVLLVTGLTTYSFHVNVFLIMLAICFATAAVLSLKPRFIQTGVVIPLLLFMISAYVTAHSYQKWKAAESWNIAREGLAGGAATLWPELHKTLGQDGKFLTEYGRWQLESGHVKEAVVTLGKARQCFISRITMEALSIAYEQSNNYEAATEARRWLCDFLPNRFVPRYKLLKLYEKTGDTANIKKTISIILRMPVKIPSAEVDRIKEEVKKMDNKGSLK